MVLLFAEATLLFRFFVLGFQTGCLGGLGCSYCTHGLLNVERCSSSTCVNGCVLPLALLQVAVQEFFPNRIHCILRFWSP